MALLFQEHSIVLKRLKEINLKCMDNLAREEIDHIGISVTENYIEGCNGVLPVIVYLAGYCCYTVNKKMNCKSCLDILIRSEIDKDDELKEVNYNYTSGISRGKLMLPDTSVVNVVRHSYIIVNKLLQTDNFKSARN